MSTSVSINFTLYVSYNILKKLYLTMEYIFVCSSSFHYWKSIFSSIFFHTYDMSVGCLVTCLVQPHIYQHPYWFVQIIWVYSNPRVLCTIWNWIVVGSIPRCPLQYHSLVHSENNSCFIGIVPIRDVELTCIFRSGFTLCE